MALELQLVLKTRFRETGDGSGPQLSSYGSNAKLVKRWTVNPVIQRMGGSNPPAPTMPWWRNW